MTKHVLKKPATAASATVKKPAADKRPATARLASASARVTVKKPAANQGPATKLLRLMASVFEKKKKPAANKRPATGNAPPMVTQADLDAMESTPPVMPGGQELRTSREVFGTIHSARLLGQGVTTEAEMFTGGNSTFHGPRTGVLRPGVYIANIIWKRFAFSSSKHNPYHTAVRLLV
jgi:hypothetical protein